MAESYRALLIDITSILTVRNVWREVAQELCC